MPRSKIERLKKIIELSEPEQNYLAHQWIKKIEHDVKHDRWPQGKIVDDYLSSIVSKVDDYPRADFIPILLENHKGMTIKRQEALFLKGKHSPNEKTALYSVLDFEVFFNEIYHDSSIATGDFEDDEDSQEEVWEKWEQFKEFKDQQKIKPTKLLRSDFETFFWATPYNIHNEPRETNIDDVCGKLGLRFEPATKLVFIRLSNEAIGSIEVKAPTTIEGGVNPDYIPSLPKDFLVGFGRTFDIIKQCDGEHEVVLQSLEVGDDPDRITFFKLGEISSDFPNRNNITFMNRL